jgi:SAM-dependent methyltransferase
MESCLRGEALYGDDFGFEELRRWYDEEKEGYAGIEDSDLAYGEYGYTALNHWHAWRFIHGQGRRFAHCVSLGGARGDDVKPVAPLVDRFTVIEPSRNFWASEIGGRRANYLPPHISGRIPLEAGSADLVTSLGTLHHIANVSFVLNEIGRVLVPQGFLVLREPIHAMGDWRQPRDGKTRNERGIPVGLLKSWLAKAGFETVRARFCVFAPFERLRRTSAGRNLWNARWFMPLDELFCSLFAWNNAYLRTSVFRKIAPGCIYIIAKRRG